MKKPYSFRRRLYGIMYLLMGIEIICLTVFIFLSTWSMRRQRFTDAKQTLALYNAQLTETLRGIDYYLMEISSYSSEFAQVAVQDDVSGSYTEIARIRNLLEYNLHSFQIIEGMYAYFPLSDTWISVQNYGGSRQIFHNYLREQVTDPDLRKQFTEAGGLRWNVVEYDGTTYLLNMFEYNRSFTGAWTKLDRMSATLTNLDEFEATVFFTDPEGRILPMWTDSVPVAASETEEKRFAEAILNMREKEGYQVVRMGGVRYLAVQEEMSMADVYATALIPLREIDHSIRDYARMTAIILAVTVAAFLIAERLIRHFLKETVSILGNVTEAIASGQEDERVDTEKIPAEEMKLIGTAFNEMVDKVQALQIEAYEENIQAKNAQLQALRSQIAPHFLINCLNMIGYLADGTEKNTQIIHQMVQTLSQHLRYTLSTRERVPLFEEIEYEKNYVALSELRFPGCITFELDVSEEASKAMVFPLILIMFTENTFKYNLVMGEPLKVIVRAEVYEKDGEKRLHLTHIDSGSGYSEDILQAGDMMNSSEIAGSDGSQVGLRNIGRRLSLYYGDSAKLVLSNEPGMGARNDMDLPYVPYQSENAEG